MWLLRREAGGRARLALSLIAAFAALSLAVTSADARVRRRAPMHGWHVGYAAIVVDAKTGKVLHETKADLARHPASLTKIMTLYLLFEQLDSGKLKLNSKIKVSERASEQPPSKLGLDEDDEIAVEDAIKALVTRSANDVAVTVAEAIGGTEQNFALLMTRKARALGMKNTTFKNASGLPDAEQITTARDLAVLGRAIQDRFPHHYRYFAIKSFEWSGVTIRGHNRLLGRIDGLDGIKTGYTRASGFNLVTNVKNNDRHVVAVVLGGTTSGARDARMRELIRAYLPRAFAGLRTAPKIAEAQEPAPARVTRVASVTTEAPAATPAPVSTPARAPNPGSAEPIRPRPVKVFTVTKTGEPTTAAPHAIGTLGVLPTTSLMAPTGAIAQPLEIGPVPTPASPAPVVATLPAPTQEPTPQPPPAATPAPVVTATPAPAVTATPAPATPSAPATSAPPSARKGWQIQIGAFPEESQARERIDAARTRIGGLLAKADPYTEPTKKGSTTLFRARFAGFDEERARHACKLLQKSEFACMAFKN